MKFFDKLKENGFSAEAIEEFKNAPKYILRTPYGEEIELQEYPKREGVRYPGWLSLHDDMGRSYIKDYHDTEVCCYPNIINEPFDCEYVGVIDVHKLWDEFKKNLNHKNELITAWNKFPAGVSYKDIKNWFEEEFNISIQNGKIALEK